MFHFENTAIWTSDPKFSFLREPWGRGWEIGHQETGLRWGRQARSQPRTRKRNEPSLRRGRWGDNLITGVCFNGERKNMINEHRRAVDKTYIKSKPTTVSEHFLSHSNHSHTDMQLIPLEKIHSSRDSVRKARESHLIDKAMTLEPHGLNRRGELLQSISLVFFLSSFYVVRHFWLSLLLRHSPSIILWLLHKFSNICKPSLKKAGMTSRNWLYKKQYMLF